MSTLDPSDTGTPSAPELAASAPRLDLEALRGLPKVELHVHLEGSIPPALALRLAQRRGIVLPGTQDGRGVVGLEEAYVFRSFGDFIRLYVAISSCLVEVEDFRDVCDGVAAELAASGVRYAEVTFTPMTHVARGVPAQVVLEGLSQGQAVAQATHGVTLAWVFDVVRSFPDQAGPTVELLERARASGQRVVGLGVGGPEGPDWPGEALAPAFARAKALGFASLPHAGEQDGPRSIWEALDLFGADRLGHGLRCLEDPRLVETLVERGVPLEVCPSSNVALGIVGSLAAHPLPALLEAGLRVSLNSDDPPLFGTDLAREYLGCVEHFGWGAMQVHAIAAAGLEQSFLEAELAEPIRVEQAGWLARYTGTG